MCINIIRIYDNHLWVGECKSNSLFYIGKTSWSFKIWCNEIKCEKCFAEPNFANHVLTNNHNIHFDIEHIIIISEQKKYAIKFSIGRIPYLWTWRFLYFEYTYRYLQVYTKRKYIIIMYYYFVDGFLYLYQ